MKRSFSVFVRQHENDAFTVASLTHPSYAAYAPTLSPALEELSRVLAGEMALGTIRTSATTHYLALRRKAIALKVRAVQHGRLLELPLRVTALYREVDEEKKRYEVWLPRLGANFTIRGEESIEPWARELVRGRFHLKDVDEVRRFEYDRGERVDDLEVNYRPIDGKRLLTARGPQVEARRLDDEEEPDAPSDVVLGGVGTDLVVTAKHGELPRCHRRDALLEQFERVLAARFSVLLVGPAGVGKTALVQELAHRVGSGRANARLAGAPIWHVTASRLMAGMVYLGMWQQRALDVLSEAQRSGAILYLDNVLELVQATQSGSAEGMSLARLIEPFVEQREVVVVFEATPDALTAAEAVEPGLISKLRRLPVPSLDGPAAHEVLAILARQLGATHGVEVSERALHRALDLIARYGDVDGLPGSGLALLERMTRRGVKGAEPLGAQDATLAFCDQTGLPRDLVDPDIVLDLSAVEAFLAERVHGQPAALERLANVVALLKAGLDDPTRPVASFLFMGPTGVGKTEAALTLAEYLFGDRERVVRLDMSEYGYAGSAQRLVDGRGGEGDLTRPIRRQPFSVLLLDEVEKAAPEIFDVLLQVLGEGRLTDATGRTVSFTHTIVIMTSNLGAAAKQPIGIASRSASSGPDYQGAARRFFRPEFLNRLDYVVPFSPLAPETLRTIARRLLRAALDREGVSRRHLEVRFDDSLVELVADVGFDPKLGARPMKRAIDQLVMVPLAIRLSRGELAGERTQISADDGAVVFEI